MGWPWGIDDFGNDCACFSPGKTPKTIFASFRDIVDCEAISLAGPPNFQFCLEQEPLAPCNWYYTDVNWAVAYHCEPGLSTLGVMNNVYARFAFVGSVPTTCCSAFSNQNKCGGAPGPIFWGGGSGLVMAPGPQNHLLCIKDFADLFNIHKSEESQSDFYPADYPVIHGHFFNREMSTNILMKVDTSEYDQYAMFEW